MKIPRIVNVLCGIDRQETSLKKLRRSNGRNIRLEECQDLSNNDW